MDQQNQQRRLGRGLSALLGGHGPVAAEEYGPQTTTEGDALPMQPAASSGENRRVSVEEIQPSPFQPRREFDGEELNELVGSIREHGVLAPLLVREFDGGYQLVAGERRLRAARKAGLQNVPVRVVDVVDQTAFEYALEENLKRSDLNDIEKARAFKRYLDQFQTTQDELAKQLSISRPALSNMLRLLELPETVQQAVEKGKISGGHAKAILSLENESDMVALCGAVQADGLSVRKTEAEARRIKEQAVEQSNDGTGDVGENVINFEAAKASHSTAHVDSLQNQLREKFGVNVDIRLTGKEKGRIVLPFADNSEFERILGILQAERMAA